MVVPTVNGGGDRRHDGVKTVRAAVVRSLDADTRTRTRGRGVGEVWQQRGSALLDGRGGEQREGAERWKASRRQEGEAGARCNSGGSERPAGGGGWHVVT
jgi:hypothetical protein